MTTTVAADWTDANQRQLVAELGSVRAALERHAGREPEPVSGTDDALTPPAALDTVCESFGLSEFERAVLLLCAGVEFDGRFPGLCAEAHGDPARPWATFGLALAALPGAHWSATTPDGPLRRWRLVEVTGSGPLTASPLRIDEHVLHFLAGVRGRDPRLAGLLSPPAAADTTPAQQAVAHRIADRLRGGTEGAGPPLAVLVGPDPAARSAVAAHAVADLGWGLAVLDAGTVPSEPQGVEELARLLEREAVFGGTAFLLDVTEPDAAAGLARFLDVLAAPAVVSVREPVTLRRRWASVFEVPSPTAGEQRELWRTYAGPDAPVEALVAAFDLGADGIHAAARAGADDPRRLWQACRERARPRLGQLAQRVAAQAGWDDLILPSPQRRLLTLLATHARHRVTVYDDWALRRGSARGVGAAALFAGPSGTGKTLAAEVLANDLNLDLYRIDLSAVISKYIGETEKNLSRVFDAAEDGGAVLLFDEADALFGKRTEVKDSHDRYANVEVSYLLQRMEAYGGVAVLTTNRKEALDSAFLRRLRFVIDFPFPDATLRAAIWRRAFPEATPTEDLDVEALARLDLAGGSIRNVAVNAAFLAAEEDGPVRMEHLWRAAGIECDKLGQPIAHIAEG